MHGLVHSEAVGKGEALSAFWRNSGEQQGRQGSEGGSLFIIEARKGGKAEGGEGGTGESWVTVGERVGE